jgi:hypothetical protein
MPGLSAAAAWILERAGLRAPPPPVDVAAAGRRAIAEARRLFASDIWDPPKTDDRPVADRWRAAITDMIAGPYGLGWSWEGEYEGDGDYEWCGAFAARCWSAGGLPLATRRPFWGSCYRLNRWARYLPIDAKTPNPRPSSGPYRLCVELDEGSHQLPPGVLAQPGDVLIVGGVGTGPGKHITLVEEFDGLAFRTIEGNATGIGPDGKRRQGVVRARRPLGLPRGAAPSTYHARWLIRPAPGDLLAVSPSR